MKVIMPAVLLSVLSGLTLCSCGNGGEGGGNFDCDASCQSRVECCQSDPDCQYLDMEVCMAECVKTLEVLKPEVITGVDECDDKPCDQMNECFGQLLSSCPGDVSGTINQLCPKMVECNPFTTLEQCQASLWSNVPVKLECFKQSVLDGLVSCVQGLECATFNDGIDQCLEDELGFRSYSDK